MAAPVINNGITRNPTGFAITLPTWLKVKGKPVQTTDKTGGNIALNSASVQLVINQLPNGKITIPTISQDQEFDPESTLIISVKEKEQARECKSYPGLKIWTDESIASLCGDSEGKKGLFSRVPEKVIADFEESFRNHAGLVRIYYKRKPIFGVVELENHSKEEREIMFFLHVRQREKTKKDTENTSPYQASFVIGWFNRVDRTDKKEAVSYENSSIKDVLKKIKEDGTNYETFYFADQPESSCFKNEPDIDANSEFFVKVGENFHPIRYVVPWPFVRGFKPPQKTKIFVMSDDPKTEEEHVLASLMETKRKKSKQSNNNKKKPASSTGSSSKKRRSSKSKEEAEDSTGVKDEDKEMTDDQKPKTKNEDSDSDSSNDEEGEQKASTNDD